MHAKEIIKKLNNALDAACREYFIKDLAGLPFPETADLGFCVARDERHGDLSSNAAMRLASSAKRPPQDIAKALIPIFRTYVEKSGLISYVKETEFKGGFLNVRFSDAYFRDLMIMVKRSGRDYGRSTSGSGKKVNIEFVSANPTGPLTIAHARQAAIGDALARILRYSGYEVTCEYYLNDCGRQINLLGKSVEVRYRNLFGIKESMPEDGYQGEYIVDMAKEVRKRNGERFLKGGPEAEGFFRKFSVSQQMANITKDLEDFGVKFDVWTSQGAIEARHEVENALLELTRKGFIYDSEGAKWFASSRLGDDKDRVVRKSDGAYTYLAPDIAYHRDKYLRGFDRLIDLLGPDHHGYINRMKAAVQALGHDAKSLDILIVQLVSLFRGGEQVRMSTRKAEFISLREILDELGKDVSRYCFLSRRLDSHLDFDIEVAKKESMDNPVYYVQYAHARICSIMKYSRKKRLALLFTPIKLDLLAEARERKLMRRIAEFPFVVESAQEALEPNRLVVYLNELAGEFHSFYTDCRVVSDDPRLTKARLFLVDLVRIVLTNGLRLLNVTMPEKM